MSIRLQIIAGFLLIVAAGFYYLTNWVIDDLRPHYLKSMEESLVDQATLLAAWVSAEADKGTLPPADLRPVFDAAVRRRFSARIYDVVKTRMNTRVYITDRRGVVVFDSDAGRDECKDYSRWNDVARTLSGEYGARATRVVQSDPATSSLYVGAPVMAGDSIVGCLSVCKPAESVNEFVAQAQRKIVIAAVVAALGVVLLGILLSTWVTLPLRRLIGYARGVRDGRREALPKLGRGEMHELGSALDEMRSALEGKQYVEHYVQTLTHEIKSPLSAIRGASELLAEDMPADKRQQFALNVQSESNRIQNIVDRMLELSQLESRRELKDVESIDVRGLMDDALAAMAALFEKGGVTLTVEGPSGVIVRGERFVLRQAIANIVQNALDFTPRGGSVIAEVKAAGAGVTITVDDTGPGVPDYALDKVFERFYSLPRPATGRKSSGLGLAFVKEAVSLHGGSVTLANRPQGGARAHISLPLAAA
jgi:two-component system, OmpR family, sensor histidine kinase CreC